MHLLRRYRVGLVLLGLLVAVGVLVVYRLTIVVFKYINELRRHGLGLREAVVRTGRTRLRPIVIPALYVILEERFPRRIEIPEGELVAQGDAA